MLIPVNYAQANIRFGGLAAPTGAEITLGLNVELYAGSPTDAAQDVLLAFQAAAIRALISSSISIASCSVKFGPNDVGPAGDFSAPLPGTASASTTSPGVAYLVRKNTGFGGRTGRGRFYIPGVTETAVNEAGTVVPATVTAGNTALEAFRATLVANGTVPTLLHSEGSPVSVPMPITSFSFDGIVATQRRRLRR